MFRHSEEDLRAARIATDKRLAIDAAFERELGIVASFLDDYPAGLTDLEILDLAIERYSKAKFAQGGIVTGQIHIDITNSARMFGLAQARAMRDLSAQLTAAMVGFGKLSTAVDPPGELELTFGSEPMVGFRVWRIVEHELRDGSKVPRLQAIGMAQAGATVWPIRRRMEAVCRYQAHEAPWPTCHCGVWAFAQKLRAVSKMGHDRDVLHGSVAMWGRVLECAVGWRAQYAYPQELFVSKRRWRRDRARLEQLASEYGIPVRISGLRDLNA